MARVTLPNGPNSSPDLGAESERLEAAIALLNDAAFGFMGIISRVVVQGGLVSRVELADAVERRAGSPAADDHNILLLTFSRALRMNLPGGRFDVIDGGRSGIDPDVT